ncbi:hypothetical protein AWB68_06947 [Caballeronia choica]|uniref:Uncharacterized protein n=1 Tax=Caballeronia choica TaxID=326476 RepID=A0A158KS18_9BURK|nr:hypothetical protein AWB68_06947 [Caballeronia choica]
MNRNGRSRSSGIVGHDAPEYPAVTAQLQGLIDLILQIAMRGFDAAILILMGSSP